MSEGALEDRYLDLLLEMVFEEQEEKEVERLAQSPDPELTEEQSSQANHMLEKALQKNDQWEKQKKKEPTAGANKTVQQRAFADPRPCAGPFFRGFHDHRGIQGSDHAHVRPGERADKQRLAVSGRRNRP